MNQDRIAIKDELRKEIMVHLTTLRERCEKMLESQDPYYIHNNYDGLHSLIGQIESATRRYIQLA